MNEISYVGDIQAEVARDFERRFQELPNDVGVIFISVNAVPALKGLTNHYEIRLGLTKNLTKDAGWAIIHKVLEKELQLVPSIFEFTANIFLGYSGACRDKGPERLNPSASKAHDTV